METVLSVFGVAVVSGVLGFATVVVKRAWTDVDFYRGQLLPVVERNTATLEKSNAEIIELKALLAISRGKEA